MKRRLTLVAAAATLALAGCASATPSSPSDSPLPTASAGHGAREGAQEVAEPQSALLSVSADGEVGVLDLLSGDEQTLGTIGSPQAIASDGRYGFVTTDAGLEVVDGGAWSWDHGDHFHFYRGEPAVEGVVEGSGPAVVTGPPLSTSGPTGIFFEGSGEAVALDMEALDAGEIVERFRLDTGADSGVVAPAGEYTVVATDDGSGAAVYDAGGEVVEDAGEECADPSGAIATRVGTVIGCADGALLATTDAGPVEFERIPYPSDEPRAEAFAGRKNRPTVAALSGEQAFWLLDTRERSWTRVEVDRPLAQVVAADDADRNVVAVDADGRVVVFGPDGAERGATDPIASEGSTLVVDAQRAYLSSPEAGVVYEIDYADGARVARELATPTAPDAAIEVGR